MKKPIATIFAAALLLILSSETPSFLQRPSLQRELQDLRQQGLTYRFLDNSTVEVKEESSGFSRIKTLQEPTEAETREWAAVRNVPILEIDPTTVDTTRFAGWYRYWGQIPLSNGKGLPLVVGDLNRNGEAEFHGSYLDFS